MLSNYCGILVANIVILIDIETYKMSIFSINGKAIDL